MMLVTFQVAKLRPGSPGWSVPSGAVQFDGTSANMEIPVQDRLLHICCGVDVENPR